MSLRTSLPPAWQQLGRSAYVKIGRRTADLRIRPEFIVIGGQRCGTTSLFRALNQHPHMVRPSFHKGINYFDINYDKGPAWYYGHFPLARTAKRGMPEPNLGPIAFEASGYYMFHPLAMSRIANDLPGVKIVAMVRDPVERAYSAWKHESARGFETKDFDSALASEDGRLFGEADAMIADPEYQSFSHRHHAYRRRGEYAKLLRNGMKSIDPANLHVMYSETFFAEPEPEFARLCRFLGAPEYSKISFDQHNARPSTSMPASARARLQEHFAPGTADLADLVGNTPPWAHD